MEAEGSVMEIGAASPLVERWCIWLEHMLTGPELRGLFKEKDSNSASSHGPSVPVVICFHPPLPYLFFPVFRPGSFVLLESEEKREKQESSVASVSPRVPCRCTNSADSGQSVLCLSHSPVKTFICLGLFYSHRVHTTLDFSSNLCAGQGYVCLRCTPKYSDGNWLFSVPWFPLSL